MVYIFNNIFIVFLIKQPHSYGMSTSFEHIQ